MSKLSKQLKEQLQIRNERMASPMSDHDIDIDVLGDDSADDERKSPATEAQRKAAHRLVEQRRRMQIQECLQELWVMVPIPDGLRNLKKHQALILSLTIEHLKDIQPKALRADIAETNLAILQKEYMMLKERNHNLEVKLMTLHSQQHAAAAAAVQQRHALARPMSMEDLDAAISARHAKATATLANQLWAAGGPPPSVPGGNPGMQSAGPPSLNIQPPPDEMPRHHPYGSDWSRRRGSLNLPTSTLTVPSSDDFGNMPPQLQMKRRSVNLDPVTLSHTALQHSVIRKLMGQTKVILQ